MKFGILSTFSVFCAIVSAGCVDRLSGPEAIKLVDALESARTPSGDERRIWWDRLFGFEWRDELARLHDVSSVELTRKGQSIAYHALVIEAVRASMPPVFECAATYRQAMLWRDGDQPEGVEFAGGRFDLPVGTPVEWCVASSGFVMRDLQPVLWASVGPAHHWRGTEGEGDISPGVVIGGCAFLSSEGNELLLNTRGVTCEITRYRVSFRGKLGQFAPAGAPPDTFRVELSPTDIVGIRYTFHCDRPEPVEKHLCPSGIRMNKAP